MTKEDIVSAVSGDTQYSRFMVERIIDSLLKNITWELSNGRSVQLNGFGTFEPKKRAARTGRNPHTREPVPIPARIIPSFRAGTHLRAAATKPVK